MFNPSDTERLMNKVVVEKIYGLLFTALRHDVLAYPIRLLNVLAKISRTFSAFRGEFSVAFVARYRELYGEISDFQPYTDPYKSADLMTQEIAYDELYEFGDAEPWMDFEEYMGQFTLADEGERGSPEFEKFATQKVLEIKEFFDLMATISAEKEPVYN